MKETSTGGVQPTVPPRTLAASSESANSTPLTLGTGVVVRVAVLVDVLVLVMVAVVRVEVTEVVVDVPVVLVQVTIASPSKAWNCTETKSADLPFLFSACTSTCVLKKATFPGGTASSFVPRERPPNEGPKYPAVAFPR
eukprot:CAMPEP_0204216658 /NCGR_PEP_ID=MMETSP0361-20130328/78356_1 /ASSEMBLY_ACC=CAM_ASM_000343 /TAXON_ID=268821 /ORGANISM="Scrippsiella Hangoei, Strain SHTV-5" /LENGTH=138 /DNA_ID=CAMNT_0051181561 /DNA_START=180 /DNA_END=596 /DNA_ORIENTATION=-